MIKNRFISAITAASIISTFAISAQAITTSAEPAEYSFGSDATVSDIFKGIATGSSSWNEELSTFLAMENGTLTVSSSRKSGYVALKNNIESARFEMTADLSVTVSNDRSSKSYATGFVFCATDTGYYELLINSDGTAAIAVSDTAETASPGDILSETDITDYMPLDGAVKLSVNGKDAVFSIDGTDVLTYTHNEEFTKGGFGFMTTRDMTAVYENFKLNYDKDVLVYEESDYAVTDYTAEVSDGAAVLSWTNPNVPYIKAITIKDSTGGELVYSGIADTTQLAQNTVKVKALSHGVEHNLRISVSFTNHADTASESKAVILPFTAEDYEITDFTVTAKIEGAKIQWTNPAAGEIADISIIDSDGNEYVHDASTDNSAGNEIEINNIPGGTTKTFILKITFADNTEKKLQGTVTAVTLEEAKYYPINVLVYESYTKIGLSWKNPEKSIKSIRVIDCATGNDAVFDDEITTESLKANNVLITGLSSTEDANFKIIFTFSDGHENVEYLAGGLPYGKGSYYDYEQVTYSSKVTDWQMFHNIQTSKYGSIPAYIYPDRDEKVSGTNSVKIVSNFAKSYSNVFARLRYSALSEYDPTLTYKISMKVKYINAKNSVLLAYANTAMNSYADGSTAPTLSVGTNLTPKENSDGWEEVSFLMKPTTASGNPREAGKELAIQAVSGGVCESFWIDDIEMVPVDAQGNVLGDSILPNGGLESEDNTSCGNVKVSSENCSLKDGTVVLNWENPDSSELKNIKIYREYEGQYFECATLSSTADTAEIGGIPTDEAVTFLIKTVDANDNYSSGTEVTVDSSVSDVVISEAQFFFGGKSVTEIPDGAEGTMSVTIDVTNNNSDTFSGSLWLAVYENGILKSVATSGTITFGSGKGTKTVKAEVKVTSESNVKAFLLDDIENMKLLSDKAELN